MVPGDSTDLTTDITEAYILNPGDEAVKTSGSLADYRNNEPVSREITQP